MRIKVEDGVVVYATHLVVADIPQEIIQSRKSPLRVLQIEPDGALCFSEKEKEQVEEILAQLGIPFTAEALTFPQEHKEKTEGLKYNSRSEAISHINDEIEMPEQEIITFLRREKKLLKERLDAVIIEKDELKTKLNQTETALLKIMFK